MAHVLPLKQKPLKSILSLAERLLVYPYGKISVIVIHWPFDAFFFRSFSATGILERSRIVPTFQKMQFSCKKVHPAPLSDSLAWFLKYRNCANRSRQVLCQPSKFAQNTGTVPTGQASLMPTLFKIDFFPKFFS